MWTDSHRRISAAVLMDYVLPFPGLKYTQTSCMSLNTLRQLGKFLEVFSFKEAAYAQSSFHTIRTDSLTLPPSLWRMTGSKPQVLMDERKESCLLEARGQ